MTERTEMCTPAERAFLDALMSTDDYVYRRENDGAIVQCGCPYCGYDGLGPISDEIAHSFTRVLSDEYGNEFVVDGWQKGWRA